jgi:hypothetical protein
LVSMFRENMRFIVWFSFAACAVHRGSNKGAPGL